MKRIASVKRAFAVAAVALCLFVIVIFKFGPRTEALNASATAAALNPITVTKTSILVPAGDGNADPGETIEHTVVITNGGTPATNVQLTDVLQSITTLSGSVAISPIAVNDTFNALGNVSISVPDGPSDLLANDTNPGGGGTLAIISPPTTSTNGGNVNINTTTGAFTYNPPPGFEGSDSFTYTLGNGSGLTDTATVNITVSGMIWFVQNGAPACTTLAGGCGRLSNPFSSLSAFQVLNNGAGNNPASNDNIFLYENVTAYTGGVTLLTGQKLIGQDATSALDAIAGVTVPTFSAPLPTMNAGAPSTLIQNAAGNGVMLGLTNTLNGFTAGNASGFAILGSGFGTVTITNVVVNTSGAGLSLNNGGFSGTGFSSFTSQGGTNNVTLTAVLGTVALGGGAISGASGTAFNVSGGTAAITYSGTLSKTAAGSLVAVSTHSNGNITLSGNLTCNTSCSGISATNNTSGTIAFSGGTKTLNTGASAAVTLTSNTGATINFTGGGLDIDTTTGNGFAATGGGTVTITTGANNNTIDTTSGTPLNITNTAIGAGGVTLATVTSTGAAANGIVLSGTSGNFTVTGATNLGTNLGSGPTGVGINILNYSTGTISLGTISIQERGNTGILINNFDGTSGTFGGTTIPNQNAAGGYGIRVQDSTAPITFASATISDANTVTLQNDGDSNGVPETDGDGDAIFLTNNTGGFTLNGGTLSNCGNDCIDLRGSSAMVLSAVSISLPGIDIPMPVSTGSGFGGHGIGAHNLTGTSSLTNVTISGFNTGNRDGFLLRNSVSTALTLTVQNSTFQNSTGNRGFGIQGHGTANMTVTVTSCTFSNISGTALQQFAGGDAGSTATVNFTVQNSTFQNSSTDGKTNLLAGVVEAGKSNVQILNNTFSDVFKTASTGEALIGVGNDGLLAGNQLALTISGNNINNVGLASSTCAGGAVNCLGPLQAISVFIDDQANVPGTIVIDNNTVTNTRQGGINLDMANAGANASNVAAKITNNCIGRLRVAGACTGADARVGQGTGLSVGTGIRVERRRLGAKQANVLVSGNTVRNGAGQNAGTLNTAGIFARTQADTRMDLTLLNNSVDTSFIGGAAEVRLDTNSPVAGDPTTQVMCVDINGNSFPAGGASVIDMNEIVGTFQVEQTSALGAEATSVRSANGGAVGVTADAGVSFNVPCAAPPALAESESEVVGLAQQNRDDDLRWLQASYRSPSESWASLFLLSCESGPQSDGKSPSMAERASMTADHLTMSEPAAMVSELESSLSEFRLVGVATGVIVTAEFGVRNAESTPQLNPDPLMFVSTLFETLGEMISPTVYSQETAPPATHPMIAGELGAGDINLGPFSIPANESLTIRFNVTVNNGPYASGVDAITNTANVTADGGVNVNSNTTSIPLDAAPDLQVTVSDGGTTTQPGAVVQYTTTYQNNTAVNGQDAAAVRITQTVPINTTFNATVSGPGWSCPDGSIGGTVCTFDVGAVNAGAPAAALNFAVNVLAALPAGAVQISDTASIAENPLNANGTDRVPANNTSNDTTNIIGNWDGSTSTAWTDPTNWSNDVVPPAGNNASIPDVANAPLITTAVSLNNLVLNGENLTIGAGGTLTLSGNLTLGANVIDGVGLLSLGTASTISRTTGQINCTLQKNFAGPGAAFLMPIGTTGAFSPLTVTVTNGAGQLTAKANTGVPVTVPPLDSTKVLQRYWTLTGSGITSNLTFQYLNGDVPVTTNEALWNVIRVTGNTAVRYPPGPDVILNAAANTFTVNNVSVYSHWTAGEPLAPTAANANVSGRIVDAEGRGINGAQVMMQNQQGEIVWATTNPFGYYRFTSVPTGQVYLFTPRHKRFQFEPRAISVNDDLVGLDFTAQPEE